MHNPLDGKLRPPGRRAQRGPDWIWKAAGTGAGVVGATIVSRLINSGRTKVSAHGDAPLNPAHERMTWPNALAWTVVIGVGGAIGRVLAQRIVASVWTHRVHLPVEAMPA